MTGDLNNDSTVNILDVILCINIVLGTEETIDNADLNGDNIVNILDIVSLVNLILG